MPVSAKRLILRQYGIPSFIRSSRLYIISESKLVDITDWTAREMYVWLEVCPWIPGFTG